MQKACGHPCGLPQFGGGWFQGLFHSPKRGSFHLSLAVLVRYRSAERIQPCGMGSTDSDGVSRVPPYLGYSRRTYIGSRTGLSPSSAQLSRSSRSRHILQTKSRNPGGHVRRFGLLRVRSPLLAESLLISSPRGTEMFHFPRFASAPYVFRCG